MQQRRYKSSTAVATCYRPHTCLNNTHLPFHMHRTHQQPNMAPHLLRLRCLNDAGMLQLLQQSFMPAHWQSQVLWLGQQLLSIHLSGWEGCKEDDKEGSGWGRTGRQQEQGQVGDEEESKRKSKG